MKQVLTTYKDRLVNISGRNRSLVLRKIYKKRSFDLVRAYSEQDFDLNELIKFLVEDEKKSSLVIGEPYRSRREQLKTRSLLLSLEKEEELIYLENMLKKQENLTAEDEAVLRIRRKDIEDKYKILQLDEVQRLENKYELMLQLSNQLNYLYRETLAIEKESGKFELYLGYPFVEGKFKDGTFVRAPFFLFPVELETKNNQWFIKNNPSRDPMVNKVFLFASVKCHQSTIKEFENLDLSEIHKNGLLDFVETELTGMGITLSKRVEGFKNLVAYSNTSMPNYKSGELNLFENMVVGQFPISNSIYDDYEKLQEEVELNGSLKQLLNNQTTEIIKNEKTFSSLVIPRKDLFTIAPIDYSQETAIKALTITSQLVIYGPPGTGKSQTISNMISDALSKGKRILMVSQKRAALDVLYNRLSPIQSKMMLIHDANKDKKSFFDKLRSQMEMGFDFISPESRVNFEANAILVDKLLNELKHIETELTKERPFGINLLQMYMKSDGIFNADDSRYPLYKVFREANPFMTFDFESLSQAFEKLNKKPFIVDTYFKYANLVEQFPYLGQMNRKISFVDKEAIISSIPNIVSFSDELRKCNKAVVNELSKYYILSILNIPDGQLKDYAVEYSKKNNPSLIDEEPVKWWNIGKLVNKVLNAKVLKENQLKYEAEEKRTVEQFLSVGHVLNDLFDSLKHIRPLLKDAGEDRLVSEVKEPNKCMLTLESLKASLQNQDYYEELSVSIQSIDAIEIKLLDFAFRHAADVVQMGHMLENLLEFIILEHIHQSEKTESFNEFYLYFNRFKQNTVQIDTLTKENELLSADVVKSLWNDKMQLFIGNADYKELKRQGDKKRQLLPIRNMLFEFTNLLFTIYPCWLMSPETVSDILPLQADSFDLIIFDEASQMFVENAIPTIFRGKKVVVSGDDKQLRPTSTFLTRVEEEEEEFLDIESAAALEEESLLDLAKVNYDQVHLNYHYRSRYEELIQFSNHAFYNGRLNVAPNRVKYHFDGTAPIERIKVQGQWINRKNNQEANRVVELVDHLLKNRNDNETIGIITFNINQKDLIEDLLDARCQIDETFKNLYQEELIRKKKDEDVSIFVKNIENVQGDERDIIIFSVGYAANEQGKVSINFGSLSQDGGENRLNVAISRAKKKCYVVTSIEPEDLYVSKTKNNGAKLFRQFLQYAKEVSDKAKDRQTSLLLQLSERVAVKEIQLDEFVEELSTRLKQMGYTIENNVGSGKYKLDIAIWDESRKAYILGIECDSMLYTNGQTLLERDIYRQRFYQARGWDVLRVWCYDWWKNSAGVLEMIGEHVKNTYQSDVELIRNPIQTTEFHLVEQGENEACWYMDRVQLRDLKSNEDFTIEIDSTPETKELLNEFKSNLIDKRIGDSIVYRDYEYKITGIMKRKK